MKCICFFGFYCPPSLPISGSQYTFKLESSFVLCCTHHLNVATVFLNEMQQDLLPILPSVLPTVVPIVFLSHPLCPAFLVVSLAYRV